MALGYEASLLRSAGSTLLITCMVGLDSDEGLDIDGAGSLTTSRTEMPRMADAAAGRSALRMGGLPGAAGPLKEWCDDIEEGCDDAEDVERRPM